VSQPQENLTNIARETATAQRLGRAKGSVQGPPQPYR
jgi:hypothetical protein